VEGRLKNTQNARRKKMGIRLLQALKKLSVLRFPVCNKKLQAIKRRDSPYTAKLSSKLKKNKE
jgi:hypothetical protein